MPIEKEIVLSMLKHTTQFNPMDSTAISRAIKKGGGDVRRIVNELRTEGNLICADTRGYWIADNRQQAEKWLQHNDQRLRAMLRARNGFKQALRRYVDKVTYQKEIFV
jgi:hypothetical protein